jgi:hypothetical protein
MDTSYWVTDEPKQKRKKEPAVTTEQEKKPSRREEKEQTGKEEESAGIKEEKKLAVNASYWVTGDIDTKLVTDPAVTTQSRPNKVVTPSAVGAPKILLPNEVVSDTKNILLLRAVSLNTSAISVPESKVVTDAKPQINLGNNIVKMEVDDRMHGCSAESGLDTFEQFEEFHLPYESDHEWNLRKSFMIAHHDKLPDDRLICMSNCFINVEVYGSSYPPAVMKELSFLKQDLGGIIEDLEERNRAKQEAKEVKFVKASGLEDADKKVSGDNGHLSHHSHSHHYQHHLSSDHKAGSESVSTSHDHKGEAQSHHHHHRSSHSDHKTGSESDATAHERKNEPEKLGGFGAALLSGSAPPKRKRKISESDHDGKPKMMAFVKADAAYSSTDNVNQSNASLGAPLEETSGFKAVIKKFEMAVGKHVQPHSELDDKFAALRQKIFEFVEKKVKRSNSIEFLQFCLDKVKMSPSTLFMPQAPGQTCEVQIDSVVVAMGEGTSKKVAKHNAFDKALESLKKPYFQIVSINPEKKELQASDTPFGDASEVIAAEMPAVLTKCGLEEVAARGMKRLHPDMNRFQNFVIIEPMNPIFDTITAAAIIRQSADFSKMKLEFDFVEHVGEYWCRVLLEHEVLGDMPGATTKDARNAAAEKALDKLRQHCYTIKTKKNEDTEATGLSRDEVLGEIAKSDEKIDSGIGNKLLKMMGWKGGGIGKKGTGIKEPIKADSGVINRQGLGLSSEKGITQNFVKCVRDVISDYAKSHRQDDMKFSPTFTNEERAVIHKECHKFGLRTRSHGRRNEDRYLVVSRKRTANELFSHIMQSGGSTSKYELFPPGSFHADSLDTW